MRAVADVVAGRHGRRAFSLLELVIAIAIVAVVAAYAVPTYVRHSARGHRMSAATALYQAAQFLEANGNSPNRSVGEGLPPGLDQAPSQGRGGLSPGYRVRRHRERRLCHRSSALRLWADARRCMRDVRA
jgi:prepilin-type N-terminal cleavage/methylation domain-containing protein